MPPPLHPKSIQTTSLFTTTLLLSFLVVTIPHILPCPVDRRQLAEGRMEGLDPKDRQRRKRRHDDPEMSYGEAREVGGAGGAGGAGGLEGQETGSAVAGYVSSRKEKSRECPVPKPGGLVGQFLGFKGEQSGRAPAVRVEAEKERIRRGENDGDRGG